MIAPEHSEADNSARERELESCIDSARVPKHIAIIMDGNGRWAKQRGLPRILGHRAGHKSVRAVVKAAPDIGVQHLTLYAFSAENWRRPTDEVDALMHLIADVLRQEVMELHEEQVQIRTMGRLEGLPEQLKAEFEHAKEITQHNTRLKLNIAINYSSRWEIVDAARTLASRVQTGELSTSQIDEESFSRALYLPDTPDPELLIRTSGERRISNYLLWQIAYSEIYITPVLWPDFRRVHLLEAIVDYQQRQRRFGAISAES